MSALKAHVGTAAAGLERATDQAELPEKGVVVESMQEAVEKERAVIKDIEADLKDAKRRLQAQKAKDKKEN